MSTVRIYAQCHCKKNTLHVDLPQSSLPLPTETCHCYDCRHITGMLANDFAKFSPLEKDIFDPIAAQPSGLTLYKKKNGRVNWYFCNTCGAHLVQTSPSKSGGLDWFFSLGTLYPLELPDGTKTTKLTRHSFVNYTKDMGGMSQYLPDGMPRYINGETGDAFLASKDTQASEEEKSMIQEAIKSPTMPLRCSCGHVNINVHRPSFKPIPNPDTKQCVVDDGWLWTFCLCSSCRTTSGFDSSPIGFVPYSHIDGPLESKHPTDGLKVYSSYPGRQRHFCPTCGCSVFFDRDDRGDLCDIFLGVIDIPLAAMFSSWMRKAKSVSFWGYAKNKEHAQILANGFCPGKDLSLTENAIKESANYDGTLCI